MRWGIIFRIFLLILVGIVVFNIANSYKAGHYALNKTGLQGRFWRTNVKASAERAIGKWKITLGEGNDFYYLLLDNHEIKQIDKDTYESIKIAKMNKSPKVEAVLKQIIEGLQSYFKNIQNLSSLTEKDFSQQ